MASLLVQFKQQRAPTVNGVPMVRLGEFDNITVYSNGIAVSTEGTVIHFDDGSVGDYATGQFTAPPNAAFPHYFVCIPAVPDEVKAVFPDETGEMDDSGQPLGFDPKFYWDRDEIIS